MKVLIDTPIWSLALRRQREDLRAADVERIAAWSEFVCEGRAAIIGPIRQEVLSGVRRDTEFERLRKALAAFDDLPLSTDDYVQAARFYNRCRSHGVAATAIDLIVCSAALRHGAAIFTTDNDFKHYARHFPIRLLS
jgi:hypothetical protein